MTQTPDSRGERQARPGSGAGHVHDGNLFAWLALVAGICSWVPLVVLVAGPLTVGFALLAFVTGAVRRRDRRRLKPALWGLVVGAVGAGLQALAFLSAASLGWIGAWFSGS